MSTRSISALIKEQQLLVAVAKTTVSEAARLMLDFVTSSKRGVCSHKGVGGSEGEQ